MPPEQLDKVLRNYLASNRFRYYPIPTPPGIVPAQFSVAPVSASDARALIADIHAHSPDYRDKALAEFQQVLQTEPNNASALRGAGFVSMQHADFEHAAEYLRRATLLDSKDARVHFYYAMLVNRHGMSGEAGAEEIKKELSVSISLDPKFAEAYSLLGYTQAISGEPEKGLTTMLKAVELAPRNEHYQLNLASVYMLNRKTDQAIAILKSLAATGSPEIATMANQSLQQAINFNAQPGRVELRIVGETKEGEAPQLSGSEGPEETEGNIEVVGTPLHFLKGKLTAIDCSQPPQAVLTVVSGTKSAHFYVRDRDHLILIGADQFSCDWKGRNVAINYRARPDGDGDVSTFEVQ